MVEMAYPTGVLEGMTREQLEEYIAFWGQRCPSAADPDVHCHDVEPGREVA